MKEFKLKKKYNNFTELVKLEKQGLIKIKRSRTLDTYGTSGSGLVAMAGVTVETPTELKNYQIIFSSRGYGTTTDNLTTYNGRFLDKHMQYFNDVDEWLKRYNLDIL